MKILLQNCLDHRYLKTLAEWTASLEEAMSFPSTEKAVSFCAEHRIPAVQVVLKFEYDQYDIRVPISEECGDGVERLHTKG